MSVLLLGVAIITAKPPAKTADTPSKIPVFDTPALPQNGMKVAPYLSMMQTHYRNQGDEANRSNHRLNLLLTRGGWREDAMVVQLPSLLKPMGIRSLTADSGEEATNVIENNVIHIALVDLSLPLRTGCPKGAPAGERILQLLRRLDSPPPTIVLRPHQANHRASARSLARSMQEGAFTVVDRPARLETLLDALQRVLRRYYRNEWPS